MAGRAISREHEETGDRAAQILEDSGFLVDREVNLEIAQGVGEQFNLDVCAIYKDALVIIEVKTERSVDFKEEILGWSKKQEKLNNYGKIRVLRSRRRRIHTKELRNIRSLAIVILHSRDQPGPEHLRQASAANIRLWNLNILMYYGETAKTLGLWTRYEIMYDLQLKTRETEKLISVPAIKAEQPGGIYYFCAMQPLDLLRIAYVYRRSKMETMAYQRIVRKTKIESMTAFFHQKDASLTNNVIVAIEPRMASEVNYKNGVLTLPGKYCSAWIVDGQHRLYGFVKTKYVDERTVEKFELPVVICDRLDAKKQTAMFVDINNNQKKIDPTLLADLSTLLQDLSRRETWPSMLAKKLVESGSFKDLVKISEIAFEENKKPITLAGLSKFVLTRYLLAPKTSKGRITDYTGLLFRYAPFDWHLSIRNKLNREALDKQFELVNSFFSVVKNVFGRKWTNSKTYGVTSYTGVNALLLVLNKILETGKSFDELKIGEYLKPIGWARVPWTRKRIRRYANWAGFVELANKMISALNEANEVKLNLY